MTAPIVSGPQEAVPYTLTGPDGTSVVFNQEAGAAVTEAEPAVLGTKTLALTAGKAAYFPFVAKNDVTIEELGFRTGEPEVKEALVVCLGVYSNNAKEVKPAAPFLGEARIVQSVWTPNTWFAEKVKTQLSAEITTFALVQGELYWFGVLLGSLSGSLNLGVNGGPSGEVRQRGPTNPKATKFNANPGTEFEAPTFQGPPNVKAVGTANTFGGYITEISGLDSPEVRENAENIAGADGGIHGPFYYGRRPVVITGEIINPKNAVDRNSKLTKLLQAANAMREDAVLSWTPEGGELQYLKLRRQQPARITGQWTKKFQLSMVSADPRIYSASLEKAEQKITYSEPLKSLPTGSLSTLLPSPDGKYLYAISNESKLIAIYSRNTTTGRITFQENSTESLGTEPHGGVITNDGLHLYVANAGTNTLSFFTRNLTTGALTFVESISTGTKPNSVAITSASHQEAAGGIILVSNSGTSTISSFKRAKATGKLSLVENFTATHEKQAGNKVGGVAISPNRRRIEGGGTAEAFGVYCADNTAKFVGIFELNETTGKLTYSEGLGEEGAVKNLKWATANNIEEMFVKFSGTFSTNVVGLGYAKSNTNYFINDNGRGATTGNEITQMSKFVGATGGIRVPTGYTPAAHENIITVLNAAAVEGEELREYYPGGSEVGYPGVVGKYGTGICAIGNYIYVGESTGKQIREFEWVESTGKILRRVSGQVFATNRGSHEVSPIIYLSCGPTGSLENPIVTNEKTGESISFSLALHANEKLEINLANRTAILNGTSSVFSNINFATTNWWSLHSGLNYIVVSATSAAEATVSVEWRNAWI